MQLPSELMETLRIYATCEHYSDHGTVTLNTTSYFGDIEILTFTTTFARNGTLSFCGNSLTDRQELFLADFDLIPSYTRKFSLNVENNIASFTATMANSTEFCVSDATFEEVFQSVNNSSFGCVSLVPCILLNATLPHFIQRFSTFSCMNSKDEGSFRTFTALDKTETEMMELAIDLKSNLIKSAKRKKVLTHTPDLRALQEAQKVFVRTHNEIAAANNQQIIDSFLNANTETSIEISYLFESVSASL